MTWISTRRSNSTAAHCAQLADHPNRDAVLGVLAQLPHIADRDLPALAEAWMTVANRHGPAAAVARDSALSPQSPLICDVLTSFDLLDTLFDDDLRAEAAYLTVPRPVTVTALKAIRDAVAAAYARPILSPAQYALLTAPWRSVYPGLTATAPDLGPAGPTIRGLLGAMETLATRRHDPAGQLTYDGLVDRSFAGAPERGEAARIAHEVAVLTGRRRLWALVCRQGADALATPGPPRQRLAVDPREQARVLGLCQDATCALLVADALPSTLTDLLVDPVYDLIPRQRRSS